MKKIAYEHMQFLVEAAISKLFNEQKDIHGWDYDEYLNMSTQLALISMGTDANGEMQERYLN